MRSHKHQQRRCAAFLPHPIISRSHSSTGPCISSLLFPLPIIAKRLPSFRPNLRSVFVPLPRLGAGNHRREIHIFVPVGLSQAYLRNVSGSSIQLTLFLRGHFAKQPLRAVLFAQQPQKLCLPFSKLLENPPPSFMPNYTLQGHPILSPFPSCN
jgi:hypothetical protein